MTALLPGVENPTILPLAHDDSKVAMHVVSQENLFWETMEQLKDIGASSILVLPIEKMMEWFVIFFALPKKNNVK